jgi:hypothetical protein
MRRRACLAVAGATPLCCSDTAKTGCCPYPLAI